VCDQETPKREAKGPSWTISALNRPTAERKHTSSLENIIITYAAKYAVSKNVLNVI
jgi:hypothetical protein